MSTLELCLKLILIIIILIFRRRTARSIYPLTLSVATTLGNKYDNVITRYIN